MRSYKMKTVGLILVMALIFSVTCVQVFAEELDTPIDDGDVVEYVHLTSDYANLYISSSGYATCYGKARSSTSTDTLEITMTLWKYTSSGWSSVQTWTNTSTGEVSCSGSRYVSSGYWYIATTTVKVWSGSTLIESVSAQSEMVYYKSQ